MWVLLSIVMALGLFGILSLTHMEQDEHAAFHTALSAIEARTAQQMDAFTTAAWAYATANNVSPGTTISVPQLVNAGYLPTAFSASNPFGQTLVALTGSGNLAAYYQNPPNTLYGIPITPGTEKGVAMKMAEKLSAMQENAPQYVAAISYDGSGTGAYTQALLPYASTAVTMSANDPQFQTTFPSLLDLVNVLPVTGSSAGVTAPTNSGGCGVMHSFVLGTYQVPVPSCAKSVNVFLAGAGGGDGGAGGRTDSKGGTGYAFSGTIAIPSGASEITVVAGGTGGNYSHKGGGGGGLSALCSGSSCTPNSAMMVAGGGGGGGSGPGQNGGDAGLTDESSPPSGGYAGGPGYGGSLDGGGGGSYGGGQPGYTASSGAYGGGGYGGGGSSWFLNGAGGGGSGYNGGASGSGSGSGGYGGQSYYGNATNIQVDAPRPAGQNGLVVIMFNP